MMADDPRDSITSAGYGAFVLAAMLAACTGPVFAVSGRYMPTSRATRFLGWRWAETVEAHPRTLERLACRQVRLLRQPRHRPPASRTPALMWRPRPPREQRTCTRRAW